MTIIQKYIVKTVIYATLLALIIVTSLSFIIGILRELHDISGEYGLQQVILHDILLLPYNVYQFFPMLVLLGGVLGLGILATSHELIVMRTAGFSINRIVWSVMCAAFILIFIATLFGEGIAPKANYLADKQKSIAKSHGQAVETKSGVWIHEGNNFLHVEEVMGVHHLEGVTRYEFDAQHHLLAAYYAESLDFTKGKWLLHDLVKTTFAENGTSSEKFPLATWDLTLTPNLLNVGLIEPEAMSLIKLAEYSHYLIKNRLQANAFQLVFWQRVLQPFTTFIMILLAVPFVFTAPRSHTMGRRILFAIVIGFIFYIVNALIGQFSVVFQMPPLIASLLPLMIFGLLGYVWMMRVRG